VAADAPKDLLGQLMRGSGNVHASQPQNREWSGFVNLDAGATSPRPPPPNLNDLIRSFAADRAIQKRFGRWED
jgi:hypothetical protein